MSGFYNAMQLGDRKSWRYKHNLCLWSFIFWHLPLLLK